MRLEYSDPPFFELKLSFQRSLENFLQALRTCSRYLKGPPSLFVDVSKEIVAARHTNQEILTKKRDFELLPLARLQHNLYTVV